MHTERLAHLPFKKVGSITSDAVVVVGDCVYRNTVFNASAQSGLYYLPRLAAAGYGTFRIELVDEPPHLVAPLLEAYRWDLYHPNLSSWHVCVCCLEGGEGVATFQWCCCTLLLCLGSHCITAGACLHTCGLKHTTLCVLEIHYAGHKEK